MREVSISVDLYCKWEITPPIYRLYVDDTLLTERTYIWNCEEQFVREHVIVNLEHGTHTLKIESVNSEFAVFMKRNFSIDKKMVRICLSECVCERECVGW